MLGAVAGMMATGETMPLPAGFLEEDCAFIHTFAETQASSSYSRALAHIEQIKTGRVVVNELRWENISVNHNDGNVNYLVFAKTYNEAMGIQTGTVLDGELVPLPIGNFVQTYRFVSHASLDSNSTSLGLKYIYCGLTVDNKVSIYGLAEDSALTLPGVAHYVSIGVP